MLVAGVLKKTAIIHIEAARGGRRMIIVTRDFAQTPRPKKCIFIDLLP